MERCFPAGRIGVVALMLWAIAGLHAQGPAKDRFADAPEPDHLSLFKLFLATHGDALDTPEFALTHHLVFDVPPRQSPECLALAPYKQDEFTRNALQARARAGLKTNLAEAADWPKTATFRMKNRERLGEYSFEKGSFPLERNMQFSLLQTNQPLMMARTSISLQGSGRSSYYPGPVQEFCTMGAGRPLQFALVLEGLERLKEVPMSSDRAEALLEARRAGMQRDRQKGLMSTGREVELELLITTGAPPMPNVLHIVPVPARIVAARVLSADTGEVLHVFDVR